LSSEWAVVPEGTTERLTNLRPELSWERLAITARTNRAQAFVVHGYEFIEQRETARFEELLVPSRSGKAATTEFVILRQKPHSGGTSGRKFSMMDLDGRDILVDRGGCGELVYRWLDVEVRPETGDSTLQNLAEFRSASSPAEAILAVYFGETYACVVSRAAYAEVMRYNPKGLALRLEEVRTSPPFLQHIVACPKSLPAGRRKELVQTASAIQLLQADGVWGLMPPKAEDFRTLTSLITRWQGYFGSERETPPAEDPAGAKPAPAADPAPSGELSERRPG
jgi:hypothetical protein